MIDGSSYPYPFLTQIPPEHGGSGWADCWQASEGAYLKAKGSAFIGMSDEQVLNAVSLATRGTPDGSGNQYTDFAQADKGLAHYGLPSVLSYDWTKVTAAPWAILLVDGTMVRYQEGGIPYPPSWFSKLKADTVADPDHFILWGPPYKGQYNWFMNPLDPTGIWQQYDLEWMKAAFSCAYLLPKVPGQAVVGPATWTSLRRFGLKSKAQHDGTIALADVPAGATGLWRGQSKGPWVYIQWRDRYGWTLREYLSGLPAA